MRNVSLIILNDLRIFFSSRENWLNLLAMPVFFTLIVGFAFDQGGPNRVRIDFIDLDQSDLSTRLAADLKSLNPRFLLCPGDNDADNQCSLADGQTRLTVDEAVARVQDGRRHGGDHSSRRVRRAGAERRPRDHRLLRR
ncbi:MAG: hypothetical protein HC802_01990 [Caldilineaceae bacterium]|nr:hypothetical protein [Caldilineaceae bacterium]